MTPEKLDTRLFEIHTPLTAYLVSAEAPCEWVETAEERLSDLRNDLAMEPTAIPSPNQIRRQIFEKLDPGYLAGMIATLPPESGAKLVRKFLVEPPVKRTEKIIIRRKKP